MSKYIDACARLVRPYEKDRNFQLRLMETNLLVYSMAPPLLLSRTNDFLALEKEATNGGLVFSYAAFTRLTFSRRVVLAHAKLRTALCGVAIERWRLAHGGSLPDSLAQLVPEFLPAIPQDPYNGEPLKFKKLPKGYLVYSVGPDLKDDGGREKPRITNCPPYVVAFGNVIWLDELPRRRGKMKTNPPVPYDITFTVER